MQVTRDEASGKVIAVMDEAEWEELNKTTAELHQRKNTVAVAAGYNEIHLSMSEDEAMRLTALLGGSNSAIPGHVDTFDIYRVLHRVVPQWYKHYHGEIDNNTYGVVKTLKG